MLENEYEKLFPGGKDECLCGSGERFKTCCKHHLRESFGAGKYARRTDGEPVSPTARLRRARAEFSCYWVRHRVHRAHFNFSNDHPLIVVDVRAMTELIEDIIYATHDSGRGQAIFECLRRLGKAVAHPQWPEQMVRLRVLAHLYPEWDGKGREPAKEELRKLRADTIVGADLLQIYVDLLGGELGLDERLAIYAQLSLISETPGQRLQYATLRALTLHFHNDHDGAMVHLQHGISAYESSEQEKDGYALFQFGKALTLCGAWGLQTEAPFDRAQAAFLAVLESGGLNVAGRANIEFERAVSFGAADKWADALLAYERAQSMDCSPRTTIAQADVLARLDRLSEAKALLLSLEYSTLPTVLKADYCLSYATYSILRNSPSARELDDLEERLGELDVSYPAFAAQLADLRQQLQRNKHLLLEEEVARLRLQLGASKPGIEDDASIRRALAAHRDLPPNRLTRALPLPQELPDYLARVCVEACSNLVDQRQLLSTAAQSREDTYTAFVTSLLRQRVAEFHWAVSEQDLGGLPAKRSTERGRRDLVFRRAGDAPFAVFEAVRCCALSNAAWATVDEHLRRMMTRYDAAGHSTAILVCRIRDTRKHAGVIADEGVGLFGPDERGWILVPRSEKGLDVFS